MDNIVLNVIVLILVMIVSYFSGRDGYDRAHTHIAEVCKESGVYELNEMIILKCTKNVKFQPIKGESFE